jgi:hypothetical protein
MMDFNSFHDGMSKLTRTRVPLLYSIVYILPLWVQLYPRRLWPMGHNFPHGGNVTHW